MLVDVDHDLVASSCVAEFEVLEFQVGLHGCGIRLVDVIEHHLVCDRLGEWIVTLKRGGRLLCLAVNLVDEIAVVILVDLAAVDVGLELEVIVLLSLLTVETDVGEQSSLLARRALVHVGLDEVEWQCLFEETNLVEVTLEPVARAECRRLSVALLLVDGSSEHRGASGDATEAVGWEGRFEYSVDIDVGHTLCAVDGHGIVVPVVVAVVARHLDGESVGAVHEFL